MGHLSADEVQRRFEDWSGPPVGPQEIVESGEESTYLFPSGAVCRSGDHQESLAETGVLPRAMSMSHLEASMAAMRRWGLIRVSVCESAGAGGTVDGRRLYVHAATVPTEAQAIRIRELARRAARQEDMRSISWDVGPDYHRPLATGQHEDLVQGLADFEAAVASHRSALR